MPTAGHLRAHLDKIAPGFYVHTAWREQYQCFEAFFWSERLSMSRLDDDQQQAAFGVLVDAVRELDSGFLLNPPPPD